MKWELIVRARANTDLEKAQDWYDRQQTGLGDEFVAAVNDVFAAIERNPHVCQVRYKKYRQILPARFPYRVVYFIKGSKVVVARVFHTLQDLTRHI